MVLCRSAPSLSIMYDCLADCVFKCLTVETKVLQTLSAGIQSLPVFQRCSAIQCIADGGQCPSSCYKLRLTLKVCSRSRPYTCTHVHQGLKASLQLQTDWPARLQVWHPALEELIRWLRESGPLHGPSSPSLQGRSISTIKTSISSLS